MATGRLGEYLRQDPQTVAFLANLQQQAAKANTGTHTGGLASLVNNLTRSYVMGQDKDKRRALSKALTKGSENQTKIIDAIKARPAMPSFTNQDLYEMDAAPGAEDVSGLKNDLQNVDGGMEAAPAMAAREAEMARIDPNSGALYGRKEALAELLRTDPDNPYAQGALLDNAGQLSNRNANLQLQQMKNQNALSTLADTRAYKSKLDAQKLIENRETYKFEQKNKAFAPVKPTKETSLIQNMKAMGIDPSSVEGQELMMRVLTTAKTKIDMNAGPKLKKGYILVPPSTPGGAVTAKFIPGGSEDPTTIQTKKEAERMAALNVENKKKLPARRSQIFAADQNAPSFEIAIDKAITAAKSSFSSGIPQQILGNVGTGPAFDLERALDTIKSNIGFGELLRIKEAGGTLGALSEMENRLLQAMQGALDPRLKKEDMIPALERVRKIHQANLAQKKRDFKEMYPKEKRPWENSVKVDVNGIPVVPTSSSGAQPKVMKFDSNGDLIS